MEIERKFLVKELPEALEQYPAYYEELYEEELDPEVYEIIAAPAETLERFGEMYGRNYAIRNRIIAQALLAAGNSKDARYLPAIRALKEAPSPLVQEYAAWAEEKMTKLPKIY